ncbi:ribonuclease HII [Cylindrospermopsis raciborskii]|uniref:Ribonuclease HII n=1 Tax=Cylindrospermopsis raciborskii CENA302 TaxID=1170768 RepID=A0A9Q5QY79_9CYAN|nr:ribonuclease HII [Cylindrospermopsis raciborskii]NLQ05317.1 ribonuclease HII [Cylindrospermopsis raciborskii MVCC19]OPH10565.1 ribonuclease HII [Cylindrospermopsis raciborskii CENA302]
MESNWQELSHLWNQEGWIAGVDEVGRGALFGPVVAAAVILPNSALSILVESKIKDSKQLSVSRRHYLAQQIAQLAVEWKIGYATTAEIDRLNILQATLLAMKRAVLKLKSQPSLCLVDGNQFIRDLLIEQQPIIQGDRRSLNIAAASIMAKVWRDDLVVRLSKKYDMYDLHCNKGYGSRKHLLALQKYGPSPLHRQSFSPCQVREDMNFKSQL